MGGTLLTVLAGEAPAPSDPGGFNGTLAGPLAMFITEELFVSGVKPENVKEV